MKTNGNSAELIQWLRSLNTFDSDMCGAMVALHEDVVRKRYDVIQEEMQLLVELEDYVKHETGNKTVI